MAVMIPNMISGKATPGEKELFKILENLPDDVFVYYNVSIKHRYPDFIVIDPRLGVLMLEVKDWSINKIRQANRKNVVCLKRGDEHSYVHPIEQAREYALTLITTIQNDLLGRILLQRDGPHKGKLIFPVGYVAVLTNISRANLCEKKLDAIFDAERTVTHDQLSTMRHLNAVDLEKSLDRYFLPKFRFDPLSKAQVDQIRGIIHPEVVVQTIQEKVLDHDQYDFVTRLRVLDADQENKARRLGPGHRLLFGVAGSGKTTILLARAKFLASDHPERRGLIVCFNRPLKSYLERQLSEFPSLTVQTFHQMAYSFGFTYDACDRFPEKLEQAIARSDKRYDFVLLDEAQDFHRVWFRCVLRLLLDPEAGDFFITGDGSQSIYRRSSFSWKSVGIHATGNRTGYLRIPYRNAINIFRLASIFSSASTFGELDGVDISLKADPKQSAGGKGRIVSFKCKDRLREIDKAVDIVSKLIGGKWPAGDRETTQPALKAVDVISKLIGGKRSAGDQEMIQPPLEERDIGIVYPGRDEVTNLVRDSLIPKIDAVSSHPVIWISDPDHLENRDDLRGNGIRVQTIGHAKGLQFRVLVFIFSDLLPSQDSSRHEQERQLFYVALTRAGEFLAILSSAESSFVKEIDDYLKVRDNDSLTL